MQNRTASMPINIERPRSALLRGVHITEFKGHVINPDPIILQETDLLLEEFLSPTKLKALTGVNDLVLVEHLEMIVDTSETSLGNFGIYLPNLKQLKLNGSHVPRIRDLGTSLAHLKVLWLSRSGLSDLDGIPTLNNLQELYLAYNEITDISPCSLLENLKCLDLEGNLIDDIKQIEFLNLCSNLVNLTLDGNPICSKPYPEANENDSNFNYRLEVIKILPSLQTLDDEFTLNTKSLTAAKTNKFDKNSSDNNNQACPFDDDWQLINELIDEGIGPPEEKLAINEAARPGSSSSHGSRTSGSVRPLSAMRPLSSYRIKTTALATRPKSRLTTSTSSGLNTAASRPSSSLLNRPNSDPVYDISNDASHLTVGPTLQGNPLRALIARRKNNPPFNVSTDNDNDKEIEPISDYVPKLTNYKSTMKSLENYDHQIVINDLKIQNKELHNEIVKWRKEHTKKLEERKQYFEPQVLKIEDTDEQPLSDIEVVDEDYEDFNNFKRFEEISNNLSSISITSLSGANGERLKSSRPKSAFKQSFDYDEENNEIKIEKIKKTEKQKDSEGKEIKRSRSKSKDKHKKHKEKEKMNSSATSLSSEYGRENSATRLKTGDTGYESLSSLSFSSLTSNSHLKISDNNLSNLNSRHQPIIVSSATSTNSNTTNTYANYIKPVTQSSLGSLKQLKTNLAPLSGIKLPK